MIGRSSGGIWLGARRTTACAKQHKTTSCSTTSSFRWTDSSASGTAGFVWNNVQPDNSDLNSQCAVLHAGSSAATVSNAVWQPAMMDDVTCSFDPAGRDPRSIYGYVCGKKPSRRWYFVDSKNKSNNCLNFSIGTNFKMPVFEKKSSVINGGVAENILLFY